MGVPVVLVEDPTDDRVSDYLNLTDVALRSRHDPAKGLFIAESSKVIRRALAAGYRPKSFLMSARWLSEFSEVLELFPDVPAYIGEPEMLMSLTGFKLHRGVLAAMHRPYLPELHEVLRDASRVAVLENIVDHTNVGAAFRAAAGLGVDAVLITPSCADPFYRRSVRVSMGTVFQVPWTRIDPWPESIATLQDMGFVTAALALSSEAITLDQLAQDQPERLAMIFGTEGDGLSKSTIAHADLVVRIPMAGGVDSLNIASAAAVAFWATRLQG